MNRTVALTLSSIFHPVWVNLLGLLLLLFCSPYLSLVLQPMLMLFYVLFIFGTTALVPMLAVGVMKLTGHIQSIMLQEQEERTIPYLVTAVMYLFDYYFLTHMHSAASIRAYVLACACIVVAVVIINHFYKISIHGASLGALTAIVVGVAHFSVIDIRYLLMGAFIISGVTLSSRLFLYAHTLTQVVTGWMLGFLIMYLIL